MVIGGDLWLTSEGDTACIYLTMKNGTGWTKLEALFLKSGTRVSSPEVALLVLVQEDVQIFEPFLQLFIPGHICWSEGALGGSSGETGLALCRRPARGTNQDTGT